MAKETSIVTVSQGSMEKVLAVKEQYALLAEVKAQILQQDVDYGIVPGTSKESLYKAGAEKFKSLFKLNTSFELVSKEEDSSRGYFRYMFSCKVKDQVGTEIGEGYGQASSYEKKYKYRWLWENEVPAHMDKSKMPTKTTAKGSKQYAILNDDEFIANTVLKMAKKRAFVDGILNATGMSAMFTQDMEDMLQVEIIQPEEPKKTTTPPEPPYATKPQPKKEDKPTPSKSESYVDADYIDVPKQETIADPPKVDVVNSKKALMLLWKNAGIVDQEEIGKLVKFNKISASSLQEDCARVLSNYAIDKDMLKRQLKTLGLLKTEVEE